MANLNPENTTFTSLNANVFSKCAPAIGTNIKQCGSVTICDAVPPTASDLETMYETSGFDFRVMEALFHHDFELKMCEAVQNGLYDFFMANKVSVRKQMQTRRMQGGLVEIAPFVLGRQYSPINNVYWLGSFFTPSGNNYTFNVWSATNIPALAESFPAGMRIWVSALSNGGSSVKTQWDVVSATLAADGSYVTLVVINRNAGSNLPADKRVVPTDANCANTHLLVQRGTPNISDFEKWCAEQPSYLNWKNVPFWVETTRNSLCKSSRYDKWRALLMGTYGNNALYKEFFYLDDTEKNKQIGADFQRRMVDQMFWGKPLPSQTLAEYDHLQTIPAYDITDDWAGANLGIDVDTPSNCVGKRANAVGIYEQLAECDRVVDLQGVQLNLPALFQELYNMMRVREGNNHPNPKTFDIFTDSITAENISQAMIKYYNAKSDGMARLNVNGEGYSMAKKANFGFSYRSFWLYWPAGVTINVITHNFFDDYLSAANMAGMQNTARVLWILDFTGIYPGILASNRVIAKTGDLKTLASINPQFACVMAVDTQEQTLMSLTWTMIVECPKSNLIVENFEAGLPEESDQGSADYTGGSGTTSTTTTPT